MFKLETLEPEIQKTNNFKKYHTFCFLPFESKIKSTYGSRRMRSNNVRKGNLVGQRGKKVIAALQMSLKSFQKTLVNYLGKREPGIAYEIE